MDFFPIAHGIPETTAWIHFPGGLRVAYIFTSLWTAYIARLLTRGYVLEINMHKRK